LIDKYEFTKKSCHKVTKAMEDVLMENSCGCHTTVSIFSRLWVGVTVKMGINTW